jgi:hypothetical protein
VPRMWCENDTWGNHFTSLSAPLVAKVAPYSRDKLRFRVVVQVGREPAFHRAQVHAFAAVIVLHLIAIDFPYREVSRFGVREIKAGDGCGGEHGKTFGQGDAGIFFGVDQIEELAFLGVIGRGRLSWRRANAAIAFVDHVFFAQRFREAVLPGVAGAFVEQFG